MRKLHHTMVCLALSLFLFSLSSAWPQARPSSTHAVSSPVTQPVPGSTAVPWCKQIPVSAAPDIERRASSMVPSISSSSMPATSMTAPPTTAPAQLVYSSSILSSLPPAMCGFVPYWNGTHSGLDILGCVASISSYNYVPTTYGYLTLASSFPQNSVPVTCVSTKGLFSCTGISITTCTKSWCNLDYYGSSDTSGTGCTDIAYSLVSSAYRTYTSKYYNYGSASITSTYTSFYTWSATYALRKNYSTTTFVTAMDSAYAITSVQTMTFQSLSSITDRYFYATSDLFCYSYYYVNYSNQQCQTIQLGQSQRIFKCLTGSSLPATRSFQAISDMGTAFAGSTIMFATSSYYYTTYFYAANIYATRTLPGFSTRTPSPSDYANAVVAHPPACVNRQNVTCPSLSQAAASCWSQAFPPGPQGCYCGKLEAFNCSASCQGSPKDRNDYFEWAMNLCNRMNITTGNNNSTTANFSVLWPEYANRTAGITEDLLIFDWRLVPSSGNTTISTSGTRKLVERAANSTSSNSTLTSGLTCSISTSAKLIPFAVPNGVVAVSIFLARREWMNQITQAYFGMPGTRTWMITALVAVCLNLIATAINAHIALRSPGYGNNAALPSLSALFIFWSSRPRTAWLATLLVEVDKDHVTYLAVAASMMLAEMLQQAIGAATFFQTVDVARKGGYYPPGALRFLPEGGKALLVYVAALIWITGFVGLLILAVRLCLLCSVRPATAALPPQTGHVQNIQHVKGKGASRQTTRQYLRSGNANANIVDASSAENQNVEVVPHELMKFHAAAQGMMLSERLTDEIWRFFFWMILPLSGQWMFWGGWVALAGDRYCPPKIGRMTAVFTVFEVIGVLLGAM